MAVAVNRLGEIEGGFVVAAGGAVLAEIALPVAGLMSLMAHEQVREALVPLRRAARALGTTLAEPFLQVAFLRSEEHTSELQSLMRISYAVFCLKKKNNTPKS